MESFGNAYRNANWRSNRRTCSFMVSGDGKDDLVSKMFELTFVRNTYGNTKHGKWVSHGGTCFLAWSTDSRSIVRDLYRRVKNCLLGKV